MNGFDKSRPLVSFGVVADVQHADCDNHYNFEKTRMRYYRDALPQFEALLKHWANGGRPTILHDFHVDGKANKIEFVLQLGDIIDGFCSRNNQTDRIIAKIKKVVDNSASNFKMYHVVGNHELYNLSRPQLLQSFLGQNAIDYRKAEPNFTSDFAINTNTICYTFSPCDNYRIIVLDAYDISLLGIDKDSIAYQELFNLFKTYNPNEDPNDGTDMTLRYMVAFNGQISDEQLRWLEHVLKLCETNHENVIIASHIPISPVEDAPMCLVWNHEVVLSLVQRYAHCIKLVLTGHTHCWNHDVDTSGIHHIVMQAILETRPDSKPAGLVVDLYKEKIVIMKDGFGDENEAPIVISC